MKHIHSMGKINHRSSAFDAHHVWFNHLAAFFLVIAWNHLFLQWMATVITLLNNEHLNVNNNWCEFLCVSGHEKRHIWRLMNMIDLLTCWLNFTFFPTLRKKSWPRVLRGMINVFSYNKLVSMAHFSWACFLTAHEQPFYQTDEKIQTNCFRFRRNFK